MHLHLFILVDWSGIANNSKLCLSFSELKSRKTVAMTTDFINFQYFRRYSVDDPVEVTKLQDSNPRNQTCLMLYIAEPLMESVTLTFVCDANHGSIHADKQLRSSSNYPLVCTCRNEHNVGIFPAPMARGQCYQFYESTRCEGGTAALGFHGNVAAPSQSLYVR